MYVSQPAEAAVRQLIHLLQLPNMFCDVASCDVYPRINKWFDDRKYDWIMFGSVGVCVLVFVSRTPHIGCNIFQSIHIAIYWVIMRQWH